MKNLTKFLDQESRKGNVAPASLFVLVEWCSAILQELAGQPALWEDWGPKVVDAHARLLEKCLAANVRESRKHASLVTSRRGWRALMKNNELREKALASTLAQLTAKQSAPTAVNAVFLGVICGVCDRIASARELLKSRVSELYTFFARELLGSRTPVPNHVASGLKDFFSGFTTQEDLEKELMPVVEKSLLRAPEVVLNDVLGHLVRSLDATIDLSEPLRKHLLKSLLSSAKSTNVNTRDGTLRTFEIIAQQSKQSEPLQAVIDEISKALKDAKSADHRTLFCSMLKTIAPLPETSPRILTTLAQLAAKEAADAALSSQLAGISRHLSFSFSRNLPVDPAVAKTLVAGLGDKKATIRRSWAVALGDTLDALDAPSLQHKPALSFAEATFEKALSSWDEVLANPVAAAQSGLATVANVVAYLSLTSLQETESAKLSAAVKKANVEKQVIGTEQKPSFLLNHRVYSKFVVEEDLLWTVKALGASAHVVARKQAPPHAREAWAQAIIFLMTSAGSSARVRKAAQETLALAYLSSPGEVASVIIDGLWTWLRHATLEEKDTIASSSRASLSRLHLVIQTISPPESVSSKIPREALEEQTIQLLVLCRPPFVSRVSWIEIALRTGIDPSNLVTKMATKCLDEVLQRTQNSENQFQMDVFRAACDAAAELAFVAPDAMSKSLNDLIQSSLNPSQLSSIGPTEAAIYRTPEGTAFVDVLASKQSQSLDKSAKDYNTLKWEQDLRDQLAKKQGQQKKLSADDQAKVKAQLAKEAKIRSDVAVIAANLRRGIGLVNSLISGPPTDTDVWMSNAASSLYHTINEGAAMVVGDSAAKAYLYLAEKITPRLGPLRRFIGVATLRGRGYSELPEGLLQEPLADLVTRVLYRLRFTAEQLQFDVTSLSYMLPLMITVLESNGVDRPPGDDADEQITLVLEFLSLHTDLFSSQVLPREGICQLLIQSMRKYPQHYRSLKDCLNGVCHAIAPDARPGEVDVFLRGTIVPETSVRASCLQAIDAELELSPDTFCVEIWLARHESEEENADIATTIWAENSLTTNSSCIDVIAPYLESSDSHLRGAAAKAYAHAVQDHIDIFAKALSGLKDIYTEKAKPPAPEKDAYGMPIKKDLKDPWEARDGVAQAIQGMAPFFDATELVSLVQFFVERGPLADRHPTARDAMVNAAVALIATKGAPHLEALMKIFETSLESPNAGSREHDLVNEAVIIMYGALARHLKAGDARIDKVISRLLTTLSTPSESVQYAIAGCVPPLITNSGDKLSSYIQTVLDQLLEGKGYPERRGAAYGLAGIVSGKGIGALREFRIMSTLKGATEEKKEPNKRQGSYLAFELLSLVLGSTFEPYVIQIVPQLLSGFGDQTTDVREACLDAAKTCFATLSGYGVKQVLPILLEGLDEYQWRSKKGACDSLGAMAYLAPQQLAVSLPEIIPPLTTVLNDSHKEVRGAANRSLQRFGEVISNPEIKSLVNILLKALSDPTKHTDEALDALLKVNFQHYLDAPSLALVVRILERGLGDRSATKRKAAQIIGSLAHLTDRKDLISHLPILVAGLRVAAVDPVPTTRATASKALGSLVEKLGEDALPDLIPSLMAALKTDTGAGDRLGSAQALSEVLAGLGIGRLEDTLPSILQNVTSSKAAVREGFMSLFIFLPACFGSSFANYLGRIIPPILAGLADDVESIRETSLRAGRLLVKNFATKAIDLLLPELQRGLADDSHRIRLSSVELVGDLLFNLTGISGKEDDDAEEGAQAAGQSLLDVLGEEKRNNILSALYISRCDTSGLVRSAAINVWKALVATPRTLKEITPTLTQVLIRRLASSNMEQKVIASNALGELIRKSGEGVLSTLLPTLEEGLQSATDADAKQGICIALRELISAASAEALEDHEAMLISIVKNALVESNEEVRDAAAEAFDSLQRLLGKKVIEQIMPHLLGLLRREDSADEALAALLTLLTEETRSNIILPNLLPTLLQSPISAFNARAVASLASVAGSAMTRRLSTVLNTLLDNIVSCKDGDRLEALDAAFDAIMLSVDEYDGLNTLIQVMLQMSKHDDHKKRRSADAHLANFFTQADELDYSRYYPDLIRALLISFDDSDEEVIKAAHAALTALVGRIPKTEQEKLVVSTRQVLGQVGVPGHALRGFAVPKGINAILPIFLQGLINGPPEQRTQAALAISEVIDKTTADGLKPFVTHITGPLIRVVSDRSAEVKAAILFTLNNLLEKIPQYVKPFLPQLQRSFTKALADTSSEVLRIRAAKALGTLITMTPRIDPLIGELVAGSKTPDSGVSDAMQKALYEVVSKVGKNMNEASRAAILALVDSDSADVDENAAITNAKLLGALIKVLPPDAASGIIKSRVLSSHFSRGSVLALNSILYESPTTLTEGYGSETVAAICKGIGHAEDKIAQNCVLAAGKYLLSESSNKSFEVTKPIFEAMVPIMAPGQSIDARRLALVVIRTVSRENNELVRPHIALLAPPVFGSVREMIIPIKLAAEAAFLSIFAVVEEDSAVFEKYLGGAGASLAPGAKRAMQDYFKRVAMRLAAQARERKEAEGGQGGLGLSNDEREDEREIWSVGKVDLGETSFE